MSKAITERRLVDVLVCHFNTTSIAKREVPYYEKRIDVLAIHNIGNEVWAIEAKVASWSRALAQAVVNLSAAERSYIAIYSENAHRVDHDVLERHGIGLISVGRRWGEVEILKEARISQYTNRIASREIRDRVTKGHRR